MSANQKKSAAAKRHWSDEEIAAELAKFDAKIEDSKANQGEIEVRDHILDKAKFLKNDAMDYPAAEKIYREAYSKSGGASKKMEILFDVLLMNLEKLDTESVKKDIATCN